MKGVSDNGDALTGGLSFTVQFPGEDGYAHVSKEKTYNMNSFEVELWAIRDALAYARKYLGATSAVVVSNQLKIIGLLCRTNTPQKEYVEEIVDECWNVADRYPFKVTYQFVWKDLTGGDGAYTKALARDAMHD